MKRLLLCCLSTIFISICCAQDKQGYLCVSGFQQRLDERCEAIMGAKLKTYIKNSDVLYIEINEQFAGAIKLAEESARIMMEEGTYQVALYPSVDCSSGMMKRFKSYEEAKSKNTKNSQVFPIQIKEGESVYLAPYFSMENDGNFLRVYIREQEFPYELYQRLLQNGTFVEK